VLRNQRIVFFDINRAGLSQAAREYGPAMQLPVDGFCARPGAIQPVHTPAGPNDTAIVGHSIAVSAVLVKNSVRQFERVPGRGMEDLALNGK